MNNVNKIVELLKELEIKTAFTVFIPSLQRDISFKQLTTEQLKKILKTALTAPIYNSEFTLTFNNIIRENCLDKSVDTNTLTVYDKLYIIYKTKIVSISPEYTFNFTEDEIDTYLLEDTSKTIDLNDIFNDFINKKIIFTNKTVNDDNCTVVCSIPTLLTEDKLESEYREEPVLDENYEKEINRIVEEAFISEITKYVSSVSINNVNINLLEIPFKDRVNIIERLPVSITGEVLKYIENYKESIEPLLSYLFVTDKGLTFKKDILLDSTFFNI